MAPSVVAPLRSCAAACLADEAVRGLLEADGAFRAEALAADPIVRVEFEHAFVVGHLGEALAVARNKAWGDLVGPSPLGPTDPVDGRRLGYWFKESAPYQRRFEQRKRLRALLGREHAKLALRALRETRGDFLAGLSEAERQAIRRTGLDAPPSGGRRRGGISSSCRRRPSNPPSPSGTERWRS